MRREDFTYREGGRRRRIDDADARPGHLRELLAEQGVMRAAEEQRVDDWRDHAALAQQRRDVLAHRLERLGRARLSGFDDRHEPRTSLLNDIAEGVQIAHRAPLRAG